MRRRLVLLSLASTVLVVVSFVLPLGLLVQRQASDAAKVSAESDAQAVAGLVALAVAVSDDPASTTGAVGDLPAGTIVVLGDGAVLGVAQSGQGTLAPEAITIRATASGHVAGGWEIALPVVGATETIVVDSFVSDEQLSAGVVGAWLLLAALGIVLVGVAVWLADRMGRGLVRPIEDLAVSAHRLAEGDLATRVEPTEPVEIREMGEAFNYLADRLDLLLIEERESVADVSHRLRTPLTSLRLQAESLADPVERAAMVAQVDRMEHSMNQVIELTRSRGAGGPGECDLNEVAAARTAFWRVLADEQGRGLSLSLGRDVGRISVSADEVGVVVDTLIENVFAHTDAGTDFSVSTGRSSESSVWLEVSDSGDGFQSPGGAERGVSGAKSTGLGLDIVRKTARPSGGDVEMDNRPGGGAVVRVRFG